jgi:hypothetical protein
MSLLLESTVQRQGVRVNMLQLQLGVHLPSGEYLQSIAVYEPKQGCNKAVGHTHDAPFRATCNRIATIRALAPQVCLHAGHGLTLFVLAWLI